MATRADELVSAVERLAGAIGIEPGAAAELARAAAMRGGWGPRAVTAPRLPSGLSHGVPWGVSLAIGEPELRVFLEAQADPADRASYLRAAAALTELAVETGARAERLTAISGEVEPLRIWHAVRCRTGATPRWHAYVCIDRARPGDAARALRAAGVEVELALGPRDRISIVSLDLAPAPRVKAYVLMPDASLDEVAALAERAAEAAPGDAHRFGRAMLGDPARRIWWLVALGFSPGDRAPRTAALHFGVPRHLDEATCAARVRELLAALDLPAAAWERARATLGGHHFVTFQRTGGAPRVTAYFLPEAAP